MRLSQEAAGKLLGVTGKYVGMLERGDKAVDEDSTISKLLAFHEGRADLGTPQDESGHAGARFKLRQARQAKGLSASQLAKAVGYSLSVYQDIEDGRSQMGEKMAKKVAGVLGIEVEELTNGSDHPIDRHPSGGTFGAIPDIKLPPGMTAKYVPLLSLAQCGPDIAWTDDAYAGEGVVAFNCKDPKAFAVRLSGDSMAPKYDAGDTAIIYPSHQPRNGDVVLARLDDAHGADVMVKVYQSSAGNVTLNSYNPVYQPMSWPRSAFAFIFPVAQVTKNLR